MPLSLRYAARSDVGLIREGNEDSGYAGPSLIAVADGMGGHAAGEVASSVAVSTMATLEDDVPSTELLDALATAVNQANDAISDMVEKHPQLDGMGTTLTALLWSGRRVGLVHVGDSRAYLLRGGEIQQITHDHTFVQQLQDEGRITADEAAVHPQRSLLLRALDGRSNPEPDLSVREVHLGDRYLVCSDGLSGVVSDAQLAEALTGTELEAAADTLIQLALRAGGPDNITCIVADVVEVDANPSEHPLVVGAAAEKRKTTLGNDSTSEIDMSGGPPLVGRPKPTRSTLWVRTLIAGVVLSIGLGTWGAYAWSQRQYYVGAEAERVAIFKGVHQKVLGKQLSSTYERQDILLADLPRFDELNVRGTIIADDLEEAYKVVADLRALAAECQHKRALAAAPKALAPREARPVPSGVRRALPRPPPRPPRWTSPARPRPPRARPWQRRAPTAATRACEAMTSPVSSSTSAPVRSRRATEGMLLLFAWGISVVAYADAGYGVEGKVPVGLAGYAATLFAFGLVAHLGVRRFARYADPVLLPAVTLLNGLGLALIYRLDFDDPGQGGAHVRLARAARGRRHPAGLDGPGHRAVPRRPRRRPRPPGAAALHLHRRRGRPRAARDPGPAARAVLAGQRRPDLGAVRGLLHPAGRVREAAADRVLRRLPGRQARRAGAGQPPVRRHRPAPRAATSARSWWPGRASLLILIGERDLGSSLLFFGVFVVLLYVATERTSWLFFGFLLFVSGAFVAYKSFAHVHRRVDIWLHPFSSDNINDAVVPTRAEPVRHGDGRPARHRAGPGPPEHRAVPQDRLHHRDGR